MTPVRCRCAFLRLCSDGLGVGNEPKELSMYEDDTPVFRELLEMAAESRQLAGALVAAVYRDHYERHEGPIMFCDASACRTAWASVRKVA